MGKDNRLLVNVLFSVITMLLEDAIAPAIEGQSTKRTHRAYANYAKQLSATGRNITSLVQAVESVLCLGVVARRRGNAVGKRTRRRRRPV